MLDEKTVKIKLEQYRRCAEDIRNYDRGLWQISSIATTVSGVLTGISLEFLDGIARSSLIFMAFLFSLAMTVTLSKYILFQLARTLHMRRVEEEFGVEIVPTSTTYINHYLKKKNETIDKPARWFDNCRANQWIVGVMVIMTILLLVLAIISPSLPKPS